MKYPKALLLYDSDTTFLEKIVNEYALFNCRRIIVVLNDHNRKKIIPRLNKMVPENVKFIINDHLEYERYYSVKTGLTGLDNPDFCFIQNIDNPFVNNILLSDIFRHRITEGYVSPRHNGRGGHPVLFGKAVIENIRSTLKNDLNLRDVLASYSCKKIEVNNPEILININTAEEYKKYFPGLS